MNDFQRAERPWVADERTMLTGFLEFQRDTLALKCAGLTDEQLRSRAVPPSELSLLGLVRHLADVERGWFRDVVNGERTRGLWVDGSGGSADFDVEGADVAEAFAVWRRECASSREIAEAAVSLDVTGTHRVGEFSLRYVLLHMIEEYARHNGHADLLRERLDGSTGE